MVLLTIVMVFPGSPDTKGSGENSPVRPFLSKSGIYELPCCNGSGYDPPGTVLSETSLNRPSAGNSVVDSTFGTTITALPDGARNTYSQLQVWSYDNRYMITVNDSYQVRDAASFAVLHEITHSSPRWIPGTHKVISVDNEPGRILTYDVDTGKEEVLMTLSQYQYITSSISFEELSRDGQWMILYIANDGSGNSRLLTVNLFEKRIAMTCDYWAQPKAAISVDGTRVAFSSDWRGNCSQAGGFVIHNLNLVEAPNNGPTISLNRSSLTFGAVLGANSTGPQTFLLDSSGAGTLNWSLTSDTSWLSASPDSGTGPMEISVSVNPGGMSSGTYSGTITVTDPNAVNSPQTVSVTLNVYSSGQDNTPFGIFETPVHGAITRSSIPVTGWALDDTSVESVKIYRLEGTQQVYIGDAVFVEGARTDVESVYPDYPNNYKAGWGYMLLTYFLPNNGNGVFAIRAVATDTSGRQVSLGTKNITCDNANAVKPFGAIDTPIQGGTASGSRFVNWGWVLTPPPNSIPSDGSTISVWVDGVSIGHPIYNNYRADIASLFPGYANSNGAVGYFYLDTTAYKNGVHTIQWTASDSAGNTDGIGSRYFVIRNGAQELMNGADAAFNAQRSMFNVDRSQIPIIFNLDLSGK
jgi:hypothetical protein